LGAPPLARNIKYTKMYHFGIKIQKKFFPEGSHENLWKPEKMFSRALL